MLPPRPISGFAPGSAPEQKPAPEPKHAAKPDGLAPPPPFQFIGGKAVPGQGVLAEDLRRSPARGSEAIMPSSRPGGSTRSSVDPVVIRDSQEPPHPSRRTSSPDRRETSRYISHATPRPGTTQALRVGPGERASKAEFTTHAIRSDDRVTLRDEFYVLYRYIARRDPHAHLTVYRGKLIDVSMGGAQVEGYMDPEVDRKELLASSVLVRMEIPLPDAKLPLALAAKANWVRHAEPAGAPEASEPQEYVAMGLSFVDVTPEQRRGLQILLMSLQALRGGLGRG